MNAPNLSNGADVSDIAFGDNHLKPTNLIGADLSNADLSGAYLTAVNISEEQLRACRSLNGATMPDGQILKSDDNPNGPTLEHWIKHKNARLADGEVE